MKLSLLIKFLYLFFLFTFLSANPLFFWEEEGIPVREIRQLAWDSAQTINEAGTVFNTWIETKPGSSTLYVQALDESGVLWFDPLIIASCSAFKSFPEIAATADGSIVIAWKESSQNQSDDNILVQKINSQGQLLWDTVNVTQGNLRNDNTAHLIPDANGNIYLIWQDLYSTIYLQHLTGEGDIHPDWPLEGLELGTFFSRSNLQASTIIEDTDLLLFLSCYDTGLRVKRISNNGDIAWEKTLTEQAHYISDISALPNGNFAFLYCSIYPSVLKLNVLEPEGNLVWDSSLILTQNGFYLDSSYIFSLADNSFIVIWKESSLDSSDICLMRFSSEGEYLWAEPVSPYTGEIQLTHDSFAAQQVQDLGVVLVWNEEYLCNLSNIMTAQFVDQNGSRLWSDSGIEISNTPLSVSSKFPRINCYFENIFITWAEFRDPLWVLCSKLLDVQGNELFNQGEELVTSLFHGNSLNFKSVQSGDNTFIVWENLTNMDNFSTVTIRIQKITEHGTFAFGEFGIPLTQSATINFQKIQDVICCENGGIIIAWTDEIYSTYINVWVQAIDINGNHLWGIDGLNMSDSENNLHGTARLTRDGSGGYYVFWEAIDLLGIWDQEIQGQRIIDGQKQWSENGISIVSHHNFPGNTWLDLMLSDACGEVILFFDEAGNELRSVRITPEGTLHNDWSEQGVLLAEIPTPHQSVKSRVIFHEGDYYFFWTVNDSHNNFYNIIGQKLSSSGDFLWDKNGKILSNNPNSRIYSPFYLVENDSIFTGWTVQNESNLYILHLEKLNQDGEHQWITQLSYNLITQTTPEAGAIFTEGYLLCSWISETTYKMQLVHAETGSLLGSSDGEIIADSSGDKTRPQVIRSPNRTAIVTWMDTRDNHFFQYEYGLYSQKINTDPSFWLYQTEENSQASLSVQLSQNYPNPFNPSTTIEFYLENDAEVHLNIYNVKGQLIERLIRGEKLKSGRHEVIWNARRHLNNNQGSGVYLYQLETCSHKLTGKMLLLK